MVTAFNIESYQLLQEDPEETTTVLFRQISAQLASGSITSPVPISSDSFTPDSRSIRINILWFSSLVLSLSSASIGILTKQWLREYLRSTASSPRENARIRQLRHEGFVRWHIPLIIALLPVLLQVAMALFFAGLLDLLWSLHPAVAGVITSFVTVALSFLVLTTLMPTFRGDCPYKSPQAMGVLILTQALVRLLSLLVFKLYQKLGWLRREWPFYINTRISLRWRGLFPGRLLALIYRKVVRTWHERERSIVRESEATLDHHVLVSADAVLMDDEFLNNVVRKCLEDTASRAAVDCLHEIVAYRADGIMDGIPHWRHSETGDHSLNTLLHLVADILPRIDPADKERTAKTLEIADRLCRAIPFESGHKETDVLFQRLFEQLAEFLARDGPVRQRSFDLMRDMWSRSRAHVSPGGKEFLVQCAYTLTSSIHSTVIHQLTTLARVAKLANEMDTFHLACEMALSFSTVPTLPRDVFAGIRSKLKCILDDLEEHFAESGSGVGPGQIASIVLALQGLAVLDPGLIGENLKRVLDSIQPPGTEGAEAPSVQGDLLGDAARALQSLRESHPHARWKPHRRGHVVHDATELEAMNVKLPTTPEKSPAPLGQPSQLQTRRSSRLEPLELSISEFPASGPDDPSSLVTSPVADSAFPSPRSYAPPEEMGPDT